MRWRELNIGVSGTVGQGQEDLGSPARLLKRTVSNRRSTVRNI
jgi:hypothetical protein